MNLREQLPGDLGCEPHLGAHAVADAPPSRGSAGSRTSARACGTLSVPSVFLGEFALLSAEMLCVQTFEGELVWWNQALEDALGYSTAELDCVNVGRLIHPEDLEPTLAELPKLLLGGQTVGFVNRYRAKDGAWRAIEWTARAAPEDCLVYSAGRDVSARVEAEQSLGEQSRRLQLAYERMERESRRKSEFLSRVSHELRTPLNSVIGFAQLLQMDSLLPGQANAVDHILRAGRHLLSLIEDLIDIGGIEAGGLELSLEPVDVASVVEEAMSITRPLAAQASVALEVRPGDGVWVLADRQRLVQVLINLLSNAVKYNVAGGAAEVGWATGPRRRVSLVVSDTGIGIDPVVASRVFEPFDRLGAESSGVTGAGVGLSLSRQLVEAMGGTIGFSSLPGKGSVFRVNLEAAEAPLEAAG
ncbi:MAG: PAS domain-containing sensor histidine kinase [Acidimicrobiales bacterium]